MKASIMLTLAMATIALGTLDAQCYVFSSGTAASLTVNITHLPPPTQSTTVPWIYQYSSDFGLAATVSLKVGQTLYTPDPNSVAPLIDVTVGEDLSSNFSSMDFNVAFSSSNYIVAGRPGVGILDRKLFSKWQFAINTSCALKCPRSNFDRRRHRPFWHNRRPDIYADISHGLLDYATTASATNWHSGD